MDPHAFDQSLHSETVVVGTYGWNKVVAKQNTK